MTGTIRQRSDQSPGRFLQFPSPGVPDIAHLGDRADKAVDDALGEYSVDPFGQPVRLLSRHAFSNMTLVARQRLASEDDRVIEQGLRLAIGPQCFEQMCGDGAAGMVSTLRRAITAANS